MFSTCTNVLTMRGVQWSVATKRAREARRNAAQVQVHWQFTTQDARIKLRKLYPTILPWRSTRVKSVKHFTGNGASRRTLGRTACRSSRSVAVGNADRCRAQGGSAVRSQKQAENGEWGACVTLVSPFSKQSHPQVAQTVSMISTLARGTITVRPSASCASNTRTHVSDST